MKFLRIIVLSILVIDTLNPVRAAEDCELRKVENGEFVRPCAARLMEGRVRWNELDEPIPPPNVLNPKIPPDPIGGTLKFNVRVTWIVAVSEEGQLESIELWKISSEAPSRLIEAASPLNMQNLLIRRVTPIEDSFRKGEYLTGYRDGKAVPYYFSFGSNL